MTAGPFSLKLSCPKRGENASSGMLSSGWWGALCERIWFYYSPTVEPQQACDPSGGKVIGHHSQARFQLMSWKIFPHHEPERLEPAKEFVFPWLIMIEPERKNPPFAIANNLISSRKVDYIHDI